MMEQLRAALRQVDDDYLTGLSNKGILKRSYKDLEGETPAYVWQGETAEVTLKSETCVIKNPLGESSCSCPSSGICRHVVTAILWLKSQIDQGEGGNQQSQEDPENQQDRGNQEGQEHPEGQESRGDQEGQGVSDSRAAGVSQEAEGNQTASDSCVRVPVKEETGTLAGEKPGEKTAALREEFLSVPLDRLKRICGSRRFQTLLSHAKSGELPELVETSIVTAAIPWEQVTVRLLSPLEHSTCTCHSKELCAHKAQALMIYQLKHGKISLKDLEDTEGAEIVIDMQQAKEAAMKVREHILEQLEMGLSRQSPEVEESLERLAIICHRAKLSDFENRLREIASEYRLYFKRSAAFLSQELLGRLLSLYALTGRVLGVETSGELAVFAGNFRSDYEPVGRLKLMGMGARSFSSKTGYEGEIYYFLETVQKKWYTWTNARPIFYEGVRRRSSFFTDRAEAPWGLPCNRELLPELEFELSNAKAAFGERLSVSQDTRGVILGKRNLDATEIQELIYEDYEELLKDYFGLQQNHSLVTGEGFEDYNGQEDSDMGDDSVGNDFGGRSSADDSTGNGSESRSFGGRRREKLALVQAYGWEQPIFDSVSQRFSWGMHDRKGRTIFVSLRYTEKEKLIIDMLERLEQRLKNKEGKSLIFFGAAYLEEGRLCLYPIEFFRRTQESIAKDLQEETNVTEADSSIPSQTAIVAADIPETMEQYRQEAVRTLSDLLASGLSSVQEDVLSALSLLAEDGRRLGLSFAGEEFSAIGEMLGSRRHRMDFQSEPVVDAMERLNRYLRACGEKLSFDRARCAMEP